jgi:hypothetical protein
MRKLLTAVFAATLPVPAIATPPKLIVAISVDQFSADLFDEYRASLTGGLARLAAGAAFRNGYQGHAATETCPGHSTILTGGPPGADRDHCQQLVRLVAGAVRQGSLLRRGRARSGLVDQRLHRVACSHARADAGRAT